MSSSTIMRATAWQVLTDFARIAVRSSFAAFAAAMRLGKAGAESSGAVASAGASGGAEELAERAPPTATPPNVRSAPAAMAGGKFVDEEEALAELRP